MRRLAAGMLAATLAAAGLAACGGGGKKSTSGAASTPAPSSSTSVGTTPTTASPKAHAPETPTSPEQKPGGAGDETPAHFDAVLTGRGGRIGPRQVSVGPYISVRVVLKSADGQRYSLRVNGKTLEAGGSSRSAQLTLAGLKPGQSYTLEQPAGGPAVKVVANAEPGP